MNTKPEPRTKRPPQPKLTSNQRIVLRLLAKHAGPIPPTQKELANGLACTQPGVRAVLIALRDLGLVAWTPRGARTLRVTDAGRAAC